MCDEKRIDIVSAFQSYGEYLSGKLLMQNDSILFEMHVRVLAHVVACIQQIPWPVQSSTWHELALQFIHTCH